MNVMDKGDTYYKRFLYMFWRYIDDLLSLNDKELFTEVFEDMIYPGVLTLNDTNNNWTD